VAWCQDVVESWHPGTAYPHTDDLGRPLSTRSCNLPLRRVVKLPIFSMKRNAKSPSGFLLGGFVKLPIFSMKFILYSAWKYDIICYECTCIHPYIAGS
jgi:hypothetical protein